MKLDELGGLEGLEGRDSAKKSDETASGGQVVTFISAF